MNHILFIGLKNFPDRLLPVRFECKLTKNDYSALMLAALMIGHHFSISAR